MSSTTALRAVLYAAHRRRIFDMCRIGFCFRSVISVAY